jgi:hypothetical protein
MTLKTKPKGYRELTVGKYTYLWKVGRAYVCIYDPLGFKDTPFIHEVLGMTGYEWSSLHPENRPTVLPSHVAAWVTKDHLPRSALKVGNRP